MLTSLPTVAKMSRSSSVEWCMIPAVAKDEIDFLTHLTSELLRSCQRRERNNVDEARFPPSSLIRAIKGTVVAFRDELLRIVLEINGLARAYGFFEDQLSRDLFVKLLAYRILGHRHVRLPLNKPEYWKLRDSLGKYVETRNTIPEIPILGALDLCAIGGMRLHTHVFGVMNAFLLEQYRCQRANVGVRPGDVVIDAGGCWGDTTLYFARTAEQVFCFECMPSNISIIRENLDLNPAESAKIRIIQKALWSRSGEKLVFRDYGPASHRVADESGVEVETQTLDDLVSANSLRRVDLIKMDIEGAEPEALIGAEQTIRKYRPQLAISIYHDVKHFALIPNWIADLKLGYRLYLDHFTIHQEETILFACCDAPFEYKELTKAA
jgi:FkbM family methyltransferase